jgi:putative membrane protein
MRSRSSMLSGIVLSFTSTNVLAQGQGYGPQMMGWGGWGFGPIFGPFLMILTLAAVIALVVILVRFFTGSQITTSPYHEASGRKPLDILKERFARGEIDKEEFEERRRILNE